MVAPSSLLSVVFLASASLVAGHAAMVKAVGDAGGQGSAIGIDPSVPRDDTRRRSGQQDSTRFKGDQADVCGETLKAGDNDIDAGTAEVMNQNGATLPQVSDGGQLMITLHQVNGDGAGPYTCELDTSATGANWTPITVTQDVPGRNGRSGAGATTDFPLDVEIPAGTTCDGTAGGQEAVCLVRCQNPANAGPFGGCVPFQIAGADAGAATASANTTAPAGAVTRKFKVRSAKLARRALVDDAEEEAEEFWSKKN